MKCYQPVLCTRGGASHVHECGFVATKVVPVLTLDGDEIGKEVVCARHAVLILGRDGILQQLRRMAVSTVQEIIRKEKERQESKGEHTPETKEAPKGTA